MSYELRIMSYELISKLNNLIETPWPKSGTGRRNSKLETSTGGWQCV